MARDFQGNAYDAITQDALYPRAYECEERGCTTTDARVEDGGAIDQCADCESYYCPAHRVPDTACHVELCGSCRHERDVQSVTVERD